VASAERCRFDAEDVNQETDSIMKNQSLVLLVVAVGCGLVAMLGVRKVISQKPVEAVETVQVLSAISAISPGVALDEMNTKFVEIAVTSVPEGAVTDIIDIAERFLKVPVMPGDWILKEKLTESRGAEASIPEGMAAVPIPVDATTSFSGMLLPGNKIDLLLTFSEENASRQSVQKTITVLEFVEVFAVDDRVYGVDKQGEAQAKNISLLVTPEQGKAVILAAKIGTLSTMMRARGGRGAGVMGKAEISQEFLTSSFMGSNLNAPSVLDARIGQKSEDAGNILPPLETVSATEETETVEEPASINELLDLEMGTKQTEDPGGSIRFAETLAIRDENTWTIEIYEGNERRLETIRLADADENKSGTPSGSWNIWDMLKSN
jgi:pilus assembly protein CpaB